MDRTRVGIFIFNEVEVACFFGKAIARSTARQLEYAFTTGNVRRVEESGRAVGQSGDWAKRRAQSVKGRG